jgi:hypothetical protein
MLNPSIVDLLNGVAATLRTEVLVELEPGPARDQVRDAVALIRRVARAVPGLTAHLVTDIADLADTVEALGGTVPPEVGALPDRGAVLDLETLTGLDLALREQLAVMADRDDLDPEAERRLRGALSRITERESALRLSPWER